MSDPRYGADALTIGPAMIDVDGQVQGAAIANRRLFVLIGGQLVSAPITYTGSDTQPTSGEIGSFVTHTGWEQLRPDNLVWAAITAADFSGSGRADLLFFYAVAGTDEDGATTNQARYRIAYELDDNGDRAYWADEVERTCRWMSSPPVSYSERWTRRPRPCGRRPRRLSVAPPQERRRASRA